MDVAHNVTHLSQNEMIKKFCGIFGLVNQSDVLSDVRGYDDKVSNEM